MGDTHKMDKDIRIVIIEDNEGFREVLKLLVNSAHNFKVVNTYSSCEEALPDIVGDTPGIVMMDLNLPGMNGIEGTKKIKGKLPSVNILVISEVGNRDTVIKAFSAGAVGYITKDIEYLEVINALKEVVEGGSPMSKRVSRSIVESFYQSVTSPLSKRETEVLQLVAYGKTYKEIAETLFVHPETIKSHLKSIYTKLNVHNKASAIMKAIQKNFIKAL